MSTDSFALALSNGIPAAMRRTRRVPFAARDVDGFVHTRADPLPGGPHVARAAEVIADVEELVIIGANYDGTIGAEPVFAVEIEGRTIYLHDYLTQVAQRAFVDWLGPIVEPHISRVAWAFRPRIGLMAALALVRRRIRHGAVFAAKADIRRFFPSTRSELIARSLSALVPDIPPEALRLAAYFGSAPIVRRNGTGAFEWHPPIHAILQGSIVGPLLSNVVGTIVIDRALERVLQRDVVALRYCDDLLLLGSDWGAVTYARDAFEEIIAEFGYIAHPDKTSPAAIDLREEPITFLGKTIFADRIETPPDRVARWVDEMRVAETPQARAAWAGTILQQLFLDTPASVDRVASMLSRQDQRIFLNVKQKRIKTRKEQFGLIDIEIRRRYPALTTTS